MILIQSNKFRSISNRITMISINRRTLCKTIGTLTTISISGCSAMQNENDSPSVGSLGFANNDRLPHTLGVQVINVPEKYSVEGETKGVPTSQQNLHTSISLRSGEKIVIPNVFTESVAYKLQFTIDGHTPEDAKEVMFNPYRNGEEFYVSIEANDGGSAAWHITAVGNKF